MTECQHACKAICDMACGKAKVVPGQPMPPVPGGTLDTTINSNTFAHLTQSSRLSGSRNYGFEGGPPPGSDWPPLSVNASVIKEWDWNSYYGVTNYTGPADLSCPASICNLSNYSHGKSAAWDAHAMYGVNPMLSRSAHSIAAPWDRTCTDYTLSKDSPVFSALGFRPIEDIATIGLRASYFKWEQAGLRGQSGMWPEKVQAERYQRQRGLWRQGSFCISEGDVSKGFGWAADGQSWAKYERITVDCGDGDSASSTSNQNPAAAAAAAAAACTVSVRFRSSTNQSTFGPQPSNLDAPVRLGIAVGAPLASHEIAVISAAQVRKRRKRPPPPSPYPLVSPQQLMFSSSEV
eukprot:SAG25_NODE_600_length_6634_cov_5.554093_4_plen_349_part_00